MTWHLLWILPLAWLVACALFGPIFDATIRLVFRQPADVRGFLHLEGVRIDVAWRRSTWLFRLILRQQCAITLRRTVVVLDGWRITDALIRHEHQHVRQWLAAPVPAVYVWRWTTNHEALEEDRETGEALGTGRE